MKLFGRDIKFSMQMPGIQEQTNKAEVGGTGTIILAGRLTEEEYLYDLKGSSAIKVYDKMRRSDGRVKATLSACTLPIRAGQWFVEPVDEDPKNVQIAEEIENNLFNDMDITWDSFLYHVLLMLPFGYMPFEKVWKVKDGQYRWKKLAPRLPKTLWRWKITETGDFDGFIQFVFMPDGEGGGQWKFIDLAAEKCLLFTNDQEGSNFEGISILRSAYKHWYYKDTLYKIDAIAAERHATGIPTFTHPPGALPKDTKALDEIGKHLHAQEQMYVRIANDYTFDIKSVQGQLRNITPSIDHHNKAICESILADFIDLGGGDKGSYALSKDKSSFFLMALEAVTRNICDTMNRHAIPQWVQYNYGVMDAYPRLQVKGLERRDVLEYGRAVAQVLAQGGMTYDLGLENELRTMFDLGEKDESDTDQMNPVTPPEGSPEPVKEDGTPDELPTAAQDDAAQQEAQKAQANKPKSSPGGSVMHSEKKNSLVSFATPYRELTTAEKFVAFTDIDNELTHGEGMIIKAAGEVQVKQIAKLADLAQKLIESKNLSKLEDLDVPFKADLAASIQSTLKELFNYGRQQVKTELAHQLNKPAKLVEPPPTMPDINLILQFLKSKSKAASNIMANKLKSAMTFEALAQIKAGIWDRAALIEAMNTIGQRELLKSAQASVTEALNFGRSFEAQQESEDIASVQYSAILDSNTCSICSKDDGEEWSYDDPLTQKYAAGNPDCDGGPRCRCMEVYIAKSERRNWG